MTDAEHAREVFAAVERAVECLDQIQHVGPTSGKAVSLDVMRIAKEALRSTTADVELSQDLFGTFPWLEYALFLPLALIFIHAIGSLTISPMQIRPRRPERRRGALCA